MTTSETIKFIATIAAAYPSQAARLSPDALEAMVPVWHEMLKDLAASQANAALARCVATSTWMPSVADIRSAAVQQTIGAARAGGDAWGDVLAAVRRYGYLRTPAFSDPVVARAVYALGWLEICNSENQVADRARFIELYEQLQVSERVEAQVAGLPAARVPDKRLGSAARISALVD